MLEKSSQFLSSEQPCEPKSLDDALKITGVEKMPSENFWLRSTKKPFDSSFAGMKGAYMTEEIFVFCGSRFSKQLDIVSDTHFSCDTVGRGLWLAIL